MVLLWRLLIVFQVVDRMVLSTTTMRTLMRFCCVTCEQKNIKDTQKDREARK
jgi:hypothetical protein